MDPFLADDVKITLYRCHGSCAKLLFLSLSLLVLIVLGPYPLLHSLKVLPLSCSVYLFVARLRLGISTSCHRTSRVTCKREVHHSASFNFLSFTSNSSPFLLHLLRFYTHHSQHGSNARWIATRQANGDVLHLGGTLVSLLAVYETGNIIPTPLEAL